MTDRSVPLIVVLIGALVLVLTACAGEEAPSEEAAVPGVEEPAVVEEGGEPTAEEEEPAPVAELFGDPIRGGVLYDKWWAPLGLDAPEDDHPLWATQDTNARSGADTWRCKECHGWDYKGADGAYGSGSHFTGFTGVAESAAAGAASVLGALKGETNPDHDFSAVMDEQALTDIALFIADETMDYDEFVGDDKLAIGGDLALGEELFGDTCTDCHGPGGTAINFGDSSDPEYIGGLARGNPWEFAHKMRFGQPDVPDMPSGIDNGWTVDEQLAVLAYAQSLPNPSLVTLGGVLYDKWWAALGVDAPEDDHPLWAIQSSNTRSGADTWRCKECHGWDYKGADGAYGSGSHFTGFTGVMGAEDIAGWLDGTANPDHDFSAFLGEEQIAMLTAFLQEGALDTSEFINDDKTVNGDPVRGEELFNAACGRCHGDDGTEINFGDEAEPEYLGTIAGDNPWEFFHKASFGQPGEHMPSGVNLGWSSQDIADVTAYAQSMPAE